MHLYHLTLKEPSAINCAVLGNFSGTKVQEIVAAKNTYLELLRPDLTTGKIHSVLSANVFALIRSITTFRIIGGSKDYIVVGSDSGGITIIEYNPTKNSFDVVHQEYFGRSGVRRVVPGQYVASDPRGRAVMIAAVEKQKIVYVLNRDANAKLTISSPLETNRMNIITFSVVGVDVGYDNPIFAALEVEFPDESNQAPRKSLVYYELDLGLNHVIRKWYTAVEPSSSALLALPGGTDGPSGVLIFSEAMITWAHQDFPICQVRLPTRSGTLDNMGTMVVVTAIHKMKRGFFILVQNEFGDLFKVVLTYQQANPDGSGATGVTEMKVKYFDTICVSTSICILKAGFLFSSSETTSHQFYQIENLGDDDDSQVEYSSNDMLALHDNLVTFNPRELQNLSLIDEIPSIAPLISSKIASMENGDTMSLYSLSGTDSEGSLQIVRRGLKISELAISELPGIPNGIWTVKLSQKDEYDAYIVVSFINASLVLAVGETVEEVSDSSILTSVPTLAIHQIGTDSLLQVYPDGLRHIKPNKKISEWKAPRTKKITLADCNERQVAIVLSSLEIVYFELDTHGNLSEYQDRKEMGSEITCVCLGPLFEDRLRSRFLTVGCKDQTMRYISLDPSSCLSNLGVQALDGVPVSCSLVYLHDGSSISSGYSGLYLLSGLQNGILVRSAIDEVTGAVSDTRTKLIGSAPVRVSKMNVGSTVNANAALALSSKSWLNYIWKGQLRIVPLSYHTLDYVSTFHAAICPFGMVAIKKNSMRILCIDRLGDEFTNIKYPLELTPKRFEWIPNSRHIVTVESQARTDGSYFAHAMETDGEDGDRQTSLFRQFGHIRRDDAQLWSSRLTVIDVDTGNFIWSKHLQKNQAAFSASTCTFSSRPETRFILIGTANQPDLRNGHVSRAHIQTYERSSDGTLSFIHQTDLEDIPTSIIEFNGRVLVGMGGSLRIYDMGKKKLLRKCELKTACTRIMTIHAIENSIFFTDIQESAYFAQYDETANQIAVLVDESIPRWITSSCMLDRSTIAVGDRFGNVGILRLPEVFCKEVLRSNGLAAVSRLKSQAYGCRFKFESLVEFHLGDVITGLSKTALGVGGKPVLVYTTLGGSMGTLAPFLTKEESDLFNSLERQVKEIELSLVGRNPTAFRGYYIPSKNVVDGDLCQLFARLPPERRREIATRLERSVPNLLKRLDDISSRYTF